MKKEKNQKIGIEVKMEKKCRWRIKRGRRTARVQGRRGK